MTATDELRRLLDERGVELSDEQMDVLLRCVESRLADGHRALERYRDMAPQHLRMARRMLDGWGVFDAKLMPAELRRFAAEDGCDAVDLAGRLLAGALGYLRFALETIEDEEVKQ